MLSRGFSEEWAAHSHRMMSIYYVSRLHDNTSASTSAVARHSTGFVHCLANRHDTSAMTLYEDTVVTLDALFRSIGGPGQ